MRSEIFNGTCSLCGVQTDEQEGTVCGNCGVNLAGEDKALELALAMNETREILRTALDLGLRHITDVEKFLREEVLARLDKAIYEAVEDQEPLGVMSVPEFLATDFGGK